LSFGVTLRQSGKPHNAGFMPWPVLSRNHRPSLQVSLQDQDFTHRRETSMADKDRPDKMSASVQTAHEQPTEIEEKYPHPDMKEAQDTLHQPARPDPDTGEVPAGPGDAGRPDRPEVSAGSPGGRQMSNRRLSIGLGIAALLAVLVLIFAMIF